MNGGSVAPDMAWFAGGDPHVFIGDEACPRGDADTVSIVAGVLGAECIADVGGTWLSDVDILRQVGLLHAAVLLKSLRIATFIRMAGKASLQWWRIQYASLYARRSWLRAVWGDFKWLKLTSSAFSEMSTDDMTAWFTLASDFPHQMLKSVKKHAGSSTLWNPL